MSFSQLEPVVTETFTRLLSHQSRLEHLDEPLWLARLRTATAFSIQWRKGSTRCLWGSHKATITLQSRPHAPTARCNPVSTAAKQTLWQSEWLPDLSVTAPLSDDNSLFPSQPPSSAKSFHPPACFTSAATCTALFCSWEMSRDGYTGVDCPYGPTSRGRHGPVLFVSAHARCRLV